MSFHRKLLLAFSATVFFVVVAVAWTVSSLTRSAFDRITQERTRALVRQFQQEFNSRGREVVKQVEAIAAAEPAVHMALALRGAQPDYGAYIPEAKVIADSHQLDFLEFLDAQGKIISSAQWPGKFGYQDASLNVAAASQGAYLKPEDLPQGSALGLFAVRAARGTDNLLFVAGGKRIDQAFLSTLDLPAGVRALLYENLAPALSAQLLLDSSGRQQEWAKIAPIIGQVLADGLEHTATIHWTARPDDDETIDASPLPGESGRVAAVLLVGSSLRSYVELNRHVRDVALLVGGAGILLAFSISSWAAWLVTRPLERLTAAARSLAAGAREVTVEVSSRDELGELAEAFNRMTRELGEQSARLVQAERVAAWRELARRLAHELKNPLFPLQLTVENLVRAHQHSPQIFEEIFSESATTLLTEIANLKSTIAQFAEFSKMPRPDFQPVDVNQIVQQVARVFQAQVDSHTKIRYRLDLDQDLAPIAADRDLVHRALCNLVLNALDAMPQGGTMTLLTRKRRDQGVRIEVRDTGKGLTGEQCERLFTPYYTTKPNGTGLGLAIVQSIISDHRGTISVTSSLGEGTSFAIELPHNGGELNREEGAASRLNATRSRLERESTSADRR
ncbi:MAG: HAMP domain-containing protein [Acidobacteria bacterium]|nr:HAMP domain-containing protein [Acidobacteriota bacterium]